eukprot:scaffold165413_cov30-Tisochrysis_lutea.AAC.4
MASPLVHLHSKLSIADRSVGGEIALAPRLLLTQVPLHVARIHDRVVSRQEHRRIARHIPRVQQVLGPPKVAAKAALHAGLTHGVHKEDGARQTGAGTKQCGKEGGAHGVGHEGCLRWRRGLVAQQCLDVLDARCRASDGVGGARRGGGGIGALLRVRKLTGSRACSHPGGRGDDHQLDGRHELGSGHRRWGRKRRYADGTAREARDQDIACVLGSDREAEWHIGGQTTHAVH